MRQCADAIILCCRGRSCALVSEVQGAGHRSRVPSQGHPAPQGRAQRLPAQPGPPHAHARGRVPAVSAGRPRAGRLGAEQWRCEQGTARMPCMHLPRCVLNVPQSSWHALSRRYPQQDMTSHQSLLHSAVGLAYGAQCRQWYPYPRARSLCCTHLSSPTQTSTTRLPPTHMHQHAHAHAAACCPSATRRRGRWWRRTCLMWSPRARWPPPRTSTSTATTAACCALVGGRAG